MNKKKNEIEQEFRAKLFETVLEKYSLIISRSLYSSKSLTIAPAKKPGEKSYQSYLEEITNMTFKDFYVDSSAYDSVIPPHKRLKKKADFSEKSYHLQMTFFTQTMNVFKENLSQDQFLIFLDKKITKDKYDKETDVKNILHYVIENAPELLLAYVNRPKYLTSFYSDILPTVLPYLKDEQKDILFDTLTSIELLKDNTNQNKIYKLLYENLKEPNKYKDRFPHLMEDETEHFCAVKSPATKIVLDYKALNSFNIHNRDYTAHNSLCSIVEHDLKQMDQYKSILGYDNSTLVVTQDSLSIYFDGENVKEEAINTVLNRLLVKSLKEPYFVDATSTKLELNEVNPIVVSLDLERNLTSSNTVSTKRKI